MNFISNQFNESHSRKIKAWASSYMNKENCKTCDGKRLKEESLHFKILKRDINEVSNFSFDELNLWINELKRKLTDNELKIANEIINEILKRIEFILAN